MVKGVGVASMQKNVKQFWVVGRELPSEATPEPTCFRIRVFAKNVVLARSQFWYEMKRQNKVRKCQGEIVSVSEISPWHFLTLFCLFISYQNWDLARTVFLAKTLILKHTGSGVVSLGSSLPTTQNCLTFFCMEATPTPLTILLLELESSP